jgi:Trk K+ transport system NAD-binding subunit
VKVFVVGGTGAIGRYVVPALPGEGHSVTSVARTPQKVTQLMQQGTRPVLVSIFDRSALADAALPLVRQLSNPEWAEMLIELHDRLRKLS